MSEKNSKDLDDTKPENRAYDKVVLPDPEEKDFTEWSVNERRAYLLRKMVNDNKLHSEIHRTDTGNKFGVSHSQICQDLDILKKYMSNHLDQDFEAEAYTLFRSAIRELKDEDPYKTVQVLEKWSGWLEDRGEIDNKSEETVNLTSSEDLEIGFTTITKEESDSSDDE